HTHTQKRKDQKLITRDPKQQQKEGFLYVMNIVEWLSQQEVSRLPLVECNAAILARDTIMAIEKAADEYYMEQFQQKPAAIKMQKVPVQQVYACDPEVPWSPTYSKNFRLGDRVSSLRSDLGVPFGTLGTIVGIHRKFLEVLTDRVVTSGTTLHNRCSENRGVLMPRTAVINLSRMFVFKPLPNPNALAETKSENTFYTEVGVHLNNTNKEANINNKHISFFLQNKKNVCFTSMTIKFKQLNIFLWKYARSLEMDVGFSHLHFLWCSSGKIVYQRKIFVMIRSPFFVRYDFLQSQTMPFP
ncbi:exonuclease II, partial [Reticulomyxa filosa]